MIDLQLSNEVKGFLAFVLIAAALWTYGLNVGLPKLTEYHGEIQDFSFGDKNCRIQTSQGIFTGHNYECDQLQSGKHLYRNENDKFEILDSPNMLEAE